MRLFLKCIYCLIVIIIGIGSSHAQVSPSLLDFARPSLDWYEIETKHFKILFHANEEHGGASRSAQVTARIAEEVYHPITELYGHEPSGKVNGSILPNSTQEITAMICGK